LSIFRRRPRREGRAKTRATALGEGQPSLGEAELAPGLRHDGAEASRQPGERLDLGQKPLDPEVGLPQVEHRREPTATLAERPAEAGLGDVGDEGDVEPRAGRVSPVVHPRSV
jgi:hypothetical protein